MVSRLRAGQFPYGLMVSDTINTALQSAHKCHTIYGNKFITIFTKTPHNLRAMLSRLMRIVKNVASYMLQTL
jgi:hypothetical protein